MKLTKENAAIVVVSLALLVVVVIGGRQQAAEEQAKSDERAQAEQARPPALFVAKGVRVESLDVRQRGNERPVRFLLRVTNTTDEDILGMQIGFRGSDDRGSIGPFWRPDIGDEPRWRLSAGETRIINGEVTGFMTRDLGNLKVVGVKLLGSSLGEISKRPEAEATGGKL